MLIQEKQGTPDSLEELLKDNDAKIKDILDKKVNKTLTLNVNKPDFICILHINFYFRNINNYPSHVIHEECINSNFQNCNINSFIPLQNTNIELVLKTILHELTHIYELYQIRNIFNQTRWHRTNGLIDFDKNITYTDNLKLIKYFRDLYYISLPHEIRAKISSLNVYLKRLNIRNEEELIEELKKTTEWSNYLTLYNFDVNRYYNDLIKNIPNNLLFILFNLFNKIMEIKTNINTKEDLLNYLKNTKRYFKKVCKNYKQKMLKSVKSIVESIPEGSTDPYENVRVIKYENYVNEMMEDKIDINYLDFY